VGGRIPALTYRTPVTVEAMLPAGMRPKATLRQRPIAILGRSDVDGACQGSFPGLPGTNLRPSEPGLVEDRMHFRLAYGLEWHRKDRFGSISAGRLPVGEDQSVG